MHKPIPVFSWSTMLFVILIVQVVLIVTLASNLIVAGTSDASTIGLLPPLNFLYTAADVLWIGAGAAIALAISGVFDLIVAACCFWYAIGRKLKLIKYVVAAMGIHFLVVSFVNFSAVGVIVYGGIWHGFMFVWLSMSAAAAAAMGVMFLTAQGSLRRLGQAHDVHIAKLDEGETF